MSQAIFITSIIHTKTSKSISEWDFVETCSALIKKNNIRNMVDLQREIKKLSCWKYAEPNYLTFDQCIIYTYWRLANNNKVPHL